MKSNAFYRNSLSIAIGLTLALPVQAIVYEYDALNRLVSARYASGKTLNYSYDAAGNLLSIKALATQNNTSINGQLLDSTGKPISGATITIGDKTVITDSNGNYQISGLPLGTYIIIASKDGYSFNPTQITLDSTNNNLTISLTGAQTNNIMQVSIGLHNCQDNSNQILTVDNSGQATTSIDAISKPVSKITADVNSDNIQEVISFEANSTNNVSILDSKGQTLTSLALTLNGESATTNLPNMLGTVFIEQNKTILAIVNAEGSDHQVALYSIDKDFKATFLRSFNPFDTTNDSRRKNEKITVCHNGKELDIASNAVSAHLNHGDSLGSCPTPPPPKKVTVCHDKKDLEILETELTTHQAHGDSLGSCPIIDNSLCSSSGEAGLLISNYQQGDVTIILVAQQGDKEIKAFDSNGNLLQTFPIPNQDSVISSLANTNLNLITTSVLPDTNTVLQNTKYVGTKEKPLEVDNYKVKGNITFENAIIGNITIENVETVKFGYNVRFNDKRYIPQHANLSDIFIRIQQPFKKVKKTPAAINLTQSIVINAPTILQQIQALYPALQQDQATGNLTLEQNNQRFSLKPIKVKQGDGTKEKGFSVMGTTILFVTQEDHEVELIPAMEDTESLGTALEQEGIGNLEVTDAGQLSALLLANTSVGFYSGVPEMFSTPVDDSTSVGFYSGVPEMFSTPVDDSTPVGLQNIDAPNLTQGNQLLRALIFKDKQGKKRKQIIYPQFAEPTSINGQLDLNGIAYFVVNGVIYRGRLDYGVIFGTNSRGSFNMQPKGDGNFIISYPSGKQQTFYPIK